MRSRLIPIIVIVVAALVTPSAAANHWVQYDLGFKESVGRTLEDDGDVVVQPGNYFHDRVNRVVYPGTSVGDGGLFLDARMGIYAGPSDIHVGSALADLTGDPEFVPPGAHDVTAWYGWWQDTNADGVIDDVHDRACAGSACAEDEFRWRGLSSASSDSMQLYVVPKTWPTAFFVGFTAGPFDYKAKFETYDMLDSTASPDDQNWRAERYATPTLDAPLLMTIHTVVVGGAPRALGGAIEYDLDDPQALVDVDRYQAINPDIEALWTATLDPEDVLDFYYGIVGPHFDAANEAANDTVSGIRPALDPIVADAIVLGDAILDIYDFIVATAFDASFEGSINTYVSTYEIVFPPQGKEPNSDADDYAGFAQFGGVGDKLGSYNTYEGYADGYHLWFDARPAWFDMGAVKLNDNPVWENRIGPTHLGFEGRVLAWRDWNGDSAFGYICDPESSDFDAERNYCSGPTDEYDPDQSREEIYEVCQAARGRGELMSVTPVGGNWPDVRVYRDDAPTALETRNDDGPIFLRYADLCDWQTIRTRDRIIFPFGATITMRAESIVGLDRLVDVARGIVNEDPEEIRDVDFLSPVL